MVIFAIKFFGVSGTISKCAAKFLGAGGFLPLTTFSLNQALRGVHISTLEHCIKQDKVYTF